MIGERFGLFGCWARRAPVAAQAHPHELAPDPDAGESVRRRGELRFPPTRLCRNTIAGFALMLVAFFALPTQGLAQSAPGTEVTNVATLTYQNLAGGQRIATSNTVAVIVAAARTPSTTEFVRLLPGGQTTATLGPSQCLANGQLFDLGLPLGPDGNALAVDQSYPINATTIYSLAETVFVRVTDADQNLDPALVETVQVQVRALDTSDTETLVITETGPATGVFTGHIVLSSAAVGLNDCSLQTAANGSIEVNYIDPLDSADTSLASATVNPLNVVFDSSTGAVVDDALITLVDAVTGQPAVIYGYDGVSEFPATVRSGAESTDASGLRYSVPNGGFVFPVIPPGQYRLLVEPGSDYLAPSLRSATELSSLPGAPYALGDASFGLVFVVGADGRANFDIPVDPFSGGLFLAKTTTTQLASPGDFVRYQLRLENTSELSPARNITITDSLPLGFVLVTDSVRRGDQAIAATQTTDGFQLVVGTLAPGEVTTVSYVAEVTGGVRGERAVNTVIARSERGVVSNTAEASIEITESLFRERSTLIGRILNADCEAPTFSEEAGVEGVRVYLEDGRYVVSDAGGRFHFEDVRPGTHVVQIDDDTVPHYLEPRVCESLSRAAGSTRSQFVQARGGALQRVDFYLKSKLPPTGRVELELSNSAGDNANEVGYQIQVRGSGEVDVDELTVTAILPDGIALKRGTAKLSSGEKVKVSRSGPAVVFRLGSRLGHWDETLTFVGRIRPKVDGTLETRALAVFNTAGGNGQRTPMATTAMVRGATQMESADYVLSLNFPSLSDRLIPTDKADLDALVAAWRDIDDISIRTIGHSDDIPIAARNRQVFADNYALSEARARSVARYLAEALNVSESQVLTTGRGPDQPVASNDDAAGRQKNRRVELIMNGSRPRQQSFLEVATASSGQLGIETAGRIPGPEALDEGPVRGPASMDDILRSSKVQVPSAESVTEGRGWVLPTPDDRPAIPSIRVAVKHEPGLRAQLFVNDEPAPALSNDGVDIGRLSGVAVTKWRAIRLTDGANRLRVDLKDASGEIVGTLERTVNFAGGPLRGEIVEQYSRLSADGKRRPIIAVRMLDGAGELARTGSVGAFRVDQPYRTWWEVEASNENNLVAVGEREPLYRVENDGIARIELEPTTRSGELVLRLKFENQREQELRTWLKPAPRDWILVGLAEGTVGYNTVSKNLQRATAAGVTEDYYDDGRVAFFAKGQIKGDFLLTLAYDTKGYAEDFTRFDSVIDPNAYYTLYGDGTESRYEAASQRKLYVKLERSQFSALFGDYDTGLSVTELARYERRLNGLNIAYQGRNLGVSAYAAEAMQAFQRDELRGNGTSGLYGLSQQQIIPQSEQIRLEVRDRLDASRVLTSTTYSRFVDYDIDYQRGTLLFKRPIASRDELFNPQFIVAEYETRAVAAENKNMGGRISAKTTGNKFEVGATVVREAEQNGRGELNGADVRLELGAATTVRAEYVDSTSQSEPVEQRGHAYRVGLEHRTGKLDLEMYHAKVDNDFGLGQQSVSEIGVEKTGVNGRLNVTDSTFIEAEVVTQENLDTGINRDIASATLNTTRGGLSANFGLLYARDETADGEERESNLLTAALAQSLADDRFTVRLSGEVPLDDSDAVTDFPSRVLAGIDWNLGRSATAFVEHEITDGANIDSEMTRVGLRAQPWQRAQFDTSVTQQMTEFGPRLFANIGAVQGWQLNERWSIDFGVDHANTLLAPTAVILDADRELISGSLTEDFVSAYAAAAYHSAEWSGNLRAETRNSDSVESLGIFGGIYREPTIGHGFSAGFELFDTMGLEGLGETRANLRLGWAFRVADSQWSFLNRTDFVVEQREGLDLIQDSWRVVNNFNANRRLGPGSELNLKYSFKFVKADFDAQSFEGFTDLIGAEYRRSFRDRWDWGVHADVYHSWRADVVDYSAGADIGYRVATNTWLAVGYNLTGFADNDFSAGNYTAQGPYIRFALKADQDTLKRIAGLVRRR